MSKPAYSPAEIIELCTSMKRNFEQTTDCSPCEDLATGWNQALDAVIGRVILDRG